MKEKREDIFKWRAFFFAGDGRDHSFFEICPMNYNVPIFCSKTFLALATKMKTRKIDLRKVYFSAVNILDEVEAFLHHEKIPHKKCIESFDADGKVKWKFVEMNYK